MAEEVMQRAEKRRDMKDKAKRKDIPIWTQISWE